MTANTIIITGDWFVDEYWFVVRHHSTISSHTGQLHYRIYSKREHPVKDLCGAGLVARVMYNIREEQRRTYPFDAQLQLTRIGSWHPFDRDLIAHFVHAKCLNQIQKRPIICNSYALTPKTCPEDVDITLHNLQDTNNPYLKKIVIGRKCH